MHKPAVALTATFLALAGLALAFGFRDAPSQQLETLSWRQSEILHVRARTHACTDALGRPRFRVAETIVRGGPAYRRWVLVLWRGRARFYCDAARQLSNPQRAIRAVFGPYGEQAVRVSYCETGGSFSVYARNGQYEGLFQVSAYWRSSVPGFAYTPLAQARHAYRVFRLTGSTWAHWACKP
jgi:hypothetical protein